MMIRIFVLLAIAFIIYHFLHGLLMWSVTRDQIDKDLRIMEESLATFC